MRKPKTRQLVRAAFNEIKGNPPSRLKQVRRKDPARARKMAVAIALDKARQRGARVPKRR